MKSIGNLIIESIIFFDVNKIDRVELSEIFVEFNLFEDIYSDSISGNLLLIDVDNLLGKFPIKGVEFLNVRLRSDYTNEYINKVFQIYEVSDRKEVGSNALIYTLNFISAEKMIDSETKISKSYKNYTNSEIVYNIWSQFTVDFRRKYFGNVDLSIIEVEDTRNISHVVIPNWNPFKSIHWLASRSMSLGNRGSSFLFYDTLRGFKFKSLESLFKTGILRANVNSEYQLEWNLSPRDTTDHTNLMIKRWITKLDVVKGSSLLDNVLNGMYANKMLSHDLLSRKYDTVEFNYKNSFDNSGGGPTYRSVYPHQHLNSEPLADLSSSSNNFRSDSFMMYNSKPNMDDFSELWKQTRISQLQQIEAIKLEVEIVGTVDIMVGDVINLRFSDITFESREQDKIYAGNYLITAVRHNVTQNDFGTVLEIVKESYQREY